jgi:hypothetical protein
VTATAGQKQLRFVQRHKDEPYIALPDVLWAIDHIRDQARELGYDVHPLDTLRESLLESWALAK